MKILIAVDGSQDSKTAVEELARRPWRPGAEVKIMHAVESAFPLLPDLMGVGAEAAREEHARAVKEGEKLLTEMSETLRGKSGDAPKIDINIDTEIITAAYGQTPQQVIVEEAGRYGADLVIVGSRGTSTWKRLFVGSVSMGVVQHAPCSVEVVRSKVANT